MGKKLLALAFGAMLLAGSASPAFAESRGDCERRIHNAEVNLQKAIRRHGGRSRQAEQRRRDLERERARCGEHRYNGFHGGW